MLAICTPVFRTVEPDFLGSLFRTLGAGGCTWIHVAGHANLPRARNYLVQEARDRKADHILFIDADIGWEPEAIGQLFDCPDDARVVAGCPQRREHDKLRFCGEPDYPVARANGRLTAGSAATAFLRIEASVFDALESSVPKYRFQGREYPAFFQTPVIDGLMLDEDVFFSRLCKANGIDVWLDPTIQLRHWHSVPMTARMADHMYSDKIKESA